MLSLSCFAVLAVEAVAEALAADRKLAAKDEAVVVNTR